MDEVYGIALSPLIWLVVEMIKRIGMPATYAAPLAAALGILVGVVYLAPDDPKRGVLVGLMIGLSASGLHSGGKALVERVS